MCSAELFSNLFPQNENEVHSQSILLNLQRKMAMSPKSQVVHQFLHPWPFNLIPLIVEAAVTMTRFAPPLSQLSRTQTSELVCIISGNNSSRGWLNVFDLSLCLHKYTQTLVEIFMATGGVLFFQRVANYFMALNFVGCKQQILLVHPAARHRREPSCQNKDWQQQQH